MRIFITLDMPESSLRLLAEQAQRGGATLVLQGLKNQSMRQTVTAVAAILGAPGEVAKAAPRWVIDPEAFSRHRITRAPTFMVDLGSEGAGGPEHFATEGCQNRCVDGDGEPVTSGTSGASGASPRSRYLAIAGDVSLSHALQAISRQAPEADSRLAPVLARLQGGGTAPPSRRSGVTR